MDSLTSKHAYHSEILLEIRELSITFLGDDEEFHAVRSVSFDIKRGEIFGLAGESGCGKSTTALAINRLLKSPAYISGGEIWFDRRNLLALSDKEMNQLRWSQIAMVFQSAMNSLNPVITVLEQFSDVLRHHERMTRNEAEQRARELLKLVNIPEERLRQYPHQFSGGMRQRLVIAIALSLRPKLIIMDEPTTALDVVVQRDILQRIYQLRAELGFSILFITHDLALMSQFCDRIAIMRHGRIVEINQANQIRQAPQHPYTKQLWASFPNIHQLKHAR